MLDGKRILALIAARSGSKGLPGKNIRMLHGKPLLAWPVLAARGAQLVDRVVISTDSAEYAQIAEEHGADAPFLRPPELASDGAGSIDVILHTLDALAAEGDVYDYVVLLEPTSPLTEAQDIDAALNQLYDARHRADAIVGIAAMVTNHPAFAVTRTAAGEPIKPLSGGDFGALPRRQNLDPVYCLDGSLYASAVAALREQRSFCHAGTLGYETARHKVFEVDDLVDFYCIEAVMQNRDAIRQAEAAEQ
jgi:CMP-N,N'-diacetyllegionaminic acid synthase